MVTVGASNGEDSCLGKTASPECLPRAEAGVVPDVGYRRHLATIGRTNSIQSIRRSTGRAGNLPKKRRHWRLTPRLRGTTGRTN